MNKGRVDRPFLIALTILVAFGLVMVFSASMYDATVNDEPGYAMFLKQFIFVCIGAAGMMALSRCNYRRFNSKRMTTMLFVFSFVLLLSVFIPGFGVEVNGARRWINLVVTTFQPSELAKVAGILYLSSLLAREPELLKKTPYGDIKTALRYGRDYEGFGGMVRGFCEWRGFRCYMPIALLCGATIIEPSMSAAMAIGVGMFFVLYYGGLRFKTMLPIFTAGAGGLAAALIAEPWRIERILVLFGKGSLDYQITQSLLAIGTGGIFGQGLGNGKQKYLFLPELQNDFIVANIGEETGLLGCLLVLGLYGFLIYRGFKIAKASPDRFGFLYTASVMTLLAFQVIVNIGVAISVLPVTGMALPFISAGGTSMIILFGMLGPILNLSRQVDLSKKGRKRQ
ncbi:MAG: putative peptidoglycan glycosyltransferase FtsW [Eubacterium sp.]|nr:putative peptidoglycan glycosyltransferase FtsW [Eubacterium sp.]